MTPELANPKMLRLVMRKAELTNARVAALDLLDALRLMLGCRDAEMERTWIAPCSWQAAEREARAAIAKAEGRAR